MHITVGDYVISDDKDRIDDQRVFEMLSQTYWAKDYPQEVVTRAIEHSLCFGIYRQNEQIGFARCVTDHATMYYLCDVVIEDMYRGQGLGKALVKFITEHELLEPLKGLLKTKDAAGLYEQYGFEINQGITMVRPLQATGEA